MRLTGRRAAATFLGLSLIIATSGGCSGGDGNGDDVDDSIAAELPVVWEAHGATFRTPEGWRISTENHGRPEDLQVESPDGTAIANLGSGEARDSVFVLNAFGREQISQDQEEIRGERPDMNDPEEIEIHGADDALFNEVVVYGEPDDFPGPNAQAFVTAKDGDRTFYFFAFAPDSPEKQELVADIVRSLRIE